MRPTLERRAKERHGFLGVVLTVLVTGLLTTSAATQLPPAQPAPAAPPALTGAERSACPAGTVVFDPADIGAGTDRRCLPVGGPELDRSRVDPLYGRIAARLIQRVPERMTGVAGNVKVVCWHDTDWRKLLVSFREAGMIGPHEYWLGWSPRLRGVIDLSYPACQLLDAIAYRNGRSALPDVAAAVGALAHETMHVAGIDDEGLADCFALQLTAVTAKALGAEHDQARLLQARNAEYAQKYRAGTEYDSPACYDGGPLDLAPESRRWP